MYSMLVMYKHITVSALVSASVYGVMFKMYKYLI